MAFLFWFSLALILYAYLLFPLVLAAASLLFPRLVRPAKNMTPPAVSILVAVHNGEKHIAEKVHNCEALEYPEAKLDIIVVSDGSSDKTVEIVRSLKPSRPLRLIEIKEHKGKNHAINQGRRVCTGDIVIMTDITALIDARALHRILQWFSVPEVGGVCSRKKLLAVDRGLEKSQASYLSYDDFIKNCESRISSIAANEGYFYAVRKALMRDIPDGVTDDSYTAMSVVSAGCRFLFDPMARASQPVRARSRSAEIARRRRIVSGSLAGIAEMRQLLNPFSYPLYSGILFSHKVLRRFVPFLILVMGCATFALAAEHAGYLALAGIQTAGLFIFFGLHCNFIVPERLPPLIGRPLAMWHYFCLGNWGTLRGVLDFFSGVRYTRWVSVNRD